MPNSRTELLFVWIKEYKNLKEIGFNLSNDYNIEYDPITCRVIIKGTTNYIRDYFAHNISNLKVLVGVNGTGKTTFTQFVLKYFVKGLNVSRIPALVITKMGKSIVLYSPPDIPVSNRDEIEGIDATQLSVAPGTPHETFIYHTPVFDPFYLDNQDFTKHDEDYHGIINLSTTCLLEKDYEQHFNTADIPTYQEMRRYHLITEFNRQVNFIASFYNTNLPFRIPHYLHLRPSLDIEVRLLDQYANDPQNIIFQYINRFRTVIFALTSKKQYKILFELNIIRAALIHFINDYFLNASAGPLNQYLPKVLSCILKRLFSNLEVNGVLSNYSSLCKELHNIIPPLFSFAHEKLDAYKIELREFRKYFIGGIRNDGNSSSIDLTQMKEEERNELLVLTGRYYGQIGISGYLDLGLSHEIDKYTNLSSGELSYLTMFSRLFWIKYRKIINNTIENNLFIIMDEAELSLHPSWQVKFIKYLNDFIKVVFSDYNVQVLLTTHSPFIISDVPPYCCLYLEEKGGRIVSSSGLVEHNSSFGANIHELLSDSFFMHDGLVGEYAKDKINMIVERLNSTEHLTKDEIDGITNTINNIGEEFINHKLRQLLKRKLNDHNK